jgi:hypothetical protein
MVRLERNWYLCFYLLSEFFPLRIFEVNLLNKQNMIFDLQNMVFDKQNMVFDKG